MMHVAQKPPPQPPDFDFDKEVRQPGLGLLMVLRGAKGAPKKRFPKRRRVKKITSAHLESFPRWTRALPSLAKAYGHVCAYCCVRIDPVTGSRTVDHYKPKDVYFNEAYEWDNYRYATLTMNRRKGVDEAICDPFGVSDDWFLLDLVTFGLSPAPNVKHNTSLHTQIQHTIVTLELDLEPMRKRREEAWKLYEDGPSPYNWWLMARDCPLVARQYVRQRGAPPAAALPLYVPPPPPP